MPKSLSAEWESEAETDAIAGDSGDSGEKMDSAEATVNSVVQLGHRTLFQDSSSLRSNFAWHPGQTAGIIAQCLNGISTIIREEARFRKGIGKVGDYDILGRYQSSKNMSSIFSVFSVLATFLVTGIQSTPAPVETVAEPVSAIEYSEFVTGSVSAEDVALFDSSAPYSYGKSKSQITVFEFSDSQCPYCRMIHKDKTLEKIVDASKGRVSLATSYYPLDFHQGAKEESVAGICYGKLAGKPAFMDFKNRAFSRSSDSYGAYYSAEDLAGFAKGYGIDSAKYESCVTDGAVVKALEESMTKASSYGISGTPGYLIVNRDTGKYVQVSGAYPIETFVKAVREAAK